MIYADKKHKSVNQLYDGMCYYFHLLDVVNNAKKFIHLIDESERELVLAGCWVHDVIEDTGETYNDVKKVCGEKVADLSYALTNEKGKTREERANDKYYSEMKEVPNAVFIKLCDRMANMNYSKKNGSSMYLKYKKELPSFIEKLYNEKYNEMFESLKSI